MIKLFTKINSNEKYNESYKKFVDILKFSLKLIILTRLIIFVIANDNQITFKIKFV